MMRFGHLMPSIFDMAYERNFDHDVRVFRAVARCGSFTAPLAISAALNR